MRGRIPKPTALRLLEGSKPTNEFEPQPEKVEGELPEPPLEVAEDPDALEAWEELGETLMALGILTKIDMGAFVALCLARSQYLKLQRRADGFLSGKTETTMGQRNLASSFRMLHDAYQRYRDLLKEFGLTPASRSRVVVKKAERSTSAFGRIAAGRTNPAA